MNTRHLQFYITTETPCSYFDDRMSANLVPDPDVGLNMPIYNRLIQHGFRRSGKHSYRPYCKGCQECVACRIPVDEFTANRSQQRCFNKNRALEFSVSKAGYSEERFELYRQYLDSRHADGSMANPSKEEFQQFLYCDWSDTRFLELRSEGRLVAVAVTDFVSDGLSAVYSFFAPDFYRRSLGTYCILKQIEYAKQLELDFVYLGYWIKGCRKMAYKSDYRPLELYVNGRWTAIS